eukprot:7006555-Karenia_brevis.AAC.1
MHCAWPCAVNLPGPRAMHGASVHGEKQGKIVDMASGLLGRLRRHRWHQRFAKATHHLKECGAVVCRQPVRPA